MSVTVPSRLCPLQHPPVCVRHSTLPSVSVPVLTCTGASLAPTSDLPSEATVVSSGEVLAGARARFTCPVGQKFSNGAVTVTRGCTSQEQLEAGTGDPITCVNGGEMTRSGMTRVGKLSDIIYPMCTKAVLHLTDRSSLVSQKVMTLRAPLGQCSLWGLYCPRGALSVIAFGKTKGQGL